MVIGRFVTRDAGNLVRVTLENGTEIRATDVHPIWSVDREEWFPAGDLVPGELVDTLTGPVAVERVERLHSGLDVYNIEVHGEHVLRVSADGVRASRGVSDGASGFLNVGLKVHDYANVGFIVDIERVLVNASDSYNILVGRGLGRVY